VQLKQMLQRWVAFYIVAISKMGMDLSTNLVKENACGDKIKTRCRFICNNSTLVSVAVPLRSELRSTNAVAFRTVDRNCWGGLGSGPTFLSTTSLQQTSAIFSTRLTLHLFSEQISVHTCICRVIQQIPILSEYSMLEKAHWSFQL